MFTNQLHHRFQAISRLLWPEADPLSPKGERLSQIEERLGVSGLQELYDRHQTRILSRSKTGETLFFEPQTLHHGFDVVGKGFVVGVDMLDVQIKPAIALRYKEVSKGRFAVDQTFYCLNHHGVVTPDQSVQAHKAITEIVSADTARKLAANKAKADAEAKARAAKIKAQARKDKHKGRRP